jgi:hypothetical protein
MLNNLKNITFSVTEICILAISILFAGISSNLFLGFRVVDLLIISFVIIFFKRKIQTAVFIVLSIWFISVFISTIIGISRETAFLASDFRFFIMLGLSAYLGYVLAFKNVDPERLFFRLLYLTVGIYFILYLIPFLRFYYVPKSFFKDEHANTIFGPSVVVLNYLFIFLVFINRKRNYTFYLYYLVAALLIYFFRISRQDLVIMMMLLLWSLVYNIYDELKLKHILAFFLILGIGVIVLYFNFNDRIAGIFEPTKDTSFIYRIMLNEAFWEDFRTSKTIYKLFGFGLGSTVSFYFNDWFGRLRFVLLDNGFLTFFMKTGIVGFLAFISLLFVPLRRLTLHQKLILLFPIVFSMFLFSHVIYNLLYIFGFYLVSYLLVNYKANQIKISS